MLPFNKAQWYLGYSSLAILTEQDRRHWLLKSDKQKEIVDELLRYYEDKHDTNTELENFFEGNRLKLQTLQILRDIRSGRVRTTNIFASIHLELDYDDPKIVSKM